VGGGSSKTSSTREHADERTVHDLLSVIHDARQPLAAVRYVVDAARAREEVPAELRETLDQLDRYATWMSVLLREPFEELGTAGDPLSAALARSPSRCEAPGSPVRLDLLVGEVADDLAAGYACDVVVQAPLAVTVTVAETALRRALGNVLDNAQRAAGPSGLVRLLVGDGGTGGFVQVDDDGPGFGRAGSGSRLGLSLVAEVAVTAGGHVEIARSDLGGTRVRLVFPAYPSPAAGTMPLS
jgi:signal transduction histidine kinase